jgi:putative flippase GtrA
LIDKTGPDVPVLHQALRFAAVGVANTLVAYLVLRGLHDGAGVGIPIASAIGYAVGVMQSFVLNRRWTFAATAAAPGGQALRFIGVNIVCGLLFSAVVTMIEPRVGMALATIIGVGFTTVIGFVLNRSFVFRAETTNRKDLP